MKFTLTLTTDNSAFHGEGCEVLEPPSINFPEGRCECFEVNLEIARILRELATRICEEGLSGYYSNVHDINGNPVGTFSLKGNSYK